MPYSVDPTTHDCYTGTAVLINKLHPFREGNGRTQRVFIAQLAHHAGYWVDYTKVDPDELMIATIQAANGMDGYLHEVFAEIVSEESAANGCNQQ